MPHLAPRGCQCSHELRPASNSSSCLPPGVGAPGKLGYHPRPPTLRQGGSDVCLRGEAGPSTAGMPVPSPPACPQPQPCRVVVCTHPSGAARARPGPRTGNGCSDGLDGAPRTQRRPQARRCARLSSTDGKSRPGMNTDHWRPRCECLSRCAVGLPVRSWWPWSLLYHPLLPPTRLARMGSPRSEANPMPAQSQAQPPGASFTSGTCSVSQCFLTSDDKINICSWWKKEKKNKSLNM